MASVVDPEKILDSTDDPEKKSTPGNRLTSLLSDEQLQELGNTDENWINILLGGSPITQSTIKSQELDIHCSEIFSDYNVALGEVINSSINIDLLNQSAISEPKTPLFLESFRSDEQGQTRPLLRAPLCGLDLNESGMSWTSSLATPRRTSSNIVLQDLNGTATSEAGPSGSSSSIGSRRRQSSLQSTTQRRSLFLSSASTEFADFPGNSTHGDGAFQQSPGCKSCDERCVPTEFCDNESNVSVEKSLPVNDTVTAISTNIATNKDPPVVNFCDTFTSVPGDSTLSSVDHNDALSVFFTSPDVGVGQRLKKIPKRKAKRKSEVMIHSQELVEPEISVEKLAGDCSFVFPALNCLESFTMDSSTEIFESVIELNEDPCQAGIVNDGLFTDDLKTDVKTNLNYRETESSAGTAPAPVLESASLLPSVISRFVSLHAYNMNRCEETNVPNLRSTPSPNVPSVQSTLNVPNMQSTLNVPNMHSTPNVPNTLSTPNVPNVHSTPNVPNVHSTLNVPNVHSTPNVPNVHSTLNVPNVHSTPNVPNMHSTLNVPNVHSTLNVPNVHSTPNVPNMHSTLNVPNVHSTPNVPNMHSTLNVPNVHSTPNVPNMQSTLNAPNMQSTPNVHSIPNVPNVCSIPNVPNMHSTPKVQNLHSTSNVPNMHSTPKATSMIHSNQNSERRLWSITTVRPIFSRTSTANLSFSPGGGDASFQLSEKTNCTSTPVRTGSVSSRTTLLGRLKSPDSVTKETNLLNSGNINSNFVQKGITAGDSVTTGSLNNSGMKHTAGSRSVGLSKLRGVKKFIYPTADQIEETCPSRVFQLGQSSAVQTPLQKSLFSPVQQTRSDLDKKPAAMNNANSTLTTNSDEVPIETKFCSKVANNDAVMVDNLNGRKIEMPSTVSENFQKPPQNFRADDKFDIQLDLKMCSDMSMQSIAQKSQNKSNQLRCNRKSVEPNISLIQKGAHRTEGRPNSEPIVDDVRLAETGTIEVVCDTGFKSANGRQISYSLAAKRKAEKMYEEILQVSVDSEIIVEKQDFDSVGKENGNSPERKSNLLSAKISPPQVERRHSNGKENISRVVEMNPAGKTNWGARDSEYVHRYENFEIDRNSNKISNLDVKQEFSGFTSGRSKPLKPTEESLRRAAKLFSEIDLDLNSSNLQSMTVEDFSNVGIHDAKFDRPGQSVGFCSARGKPLKPSEESLCKAASILLEVEAGLEAGASDLNTVNNFNSIETNSKVCNLKNNSSVPDFGFCTGKGQPVKPSSESLQKAASLISEIESDPYSLNPNQKSYNPTISTKDKSKNINKFQTSEHSDLPIGFRPFKMPRQSAKPLKTKVEPVEAKSTGNITVLPSGNDFSDLTFTQIAEVTDASMVLLEHGEVFSTQAFHDDDVKNEEVLHQNVGSITGLDENDSIYASLCLEELTKNETSGGIQPKVDYQEFESIETSYKPCVETGNEEMVEGDRPRKEAKTVDELLHYIADSNFDTMTQVCEMDNDGSKNVGQTIEHRHSKLADDDDEWNGDSMMEDWCVAETRRTFQRIEDESKIDEQINVGRVVQADVSVSTDAFFTPSTDWGECGFRKAKGVEIKICDETLKKVEQLFRDQGGDFETDFETESVGFEDSELEKIVEIENAKSLPEQSDQNACVADPGGVQLCEGACEIPLEHENVVPKQCHSAGADAQNIFDDLSFDLAACMEESMNEPDCSKNSVLHRADDATELHEDIQQTACEVHTSSGLEFQTGETDLNRFDGPAVATNENFKSEISNVPGQVPQETEPGSEFSIGFKTASGRSVAVDDTALVKARKILEECLVDPFGNSCGVSKNFPAKLSENGDHVNISSGNGDGQNCDNTDNVAGRDISQKDLPRPEFSIGFSTASGRSVAVDESSLAKAKKLLEECSKDSDTSQFSRVKEDMCKSSEVCDYKNTRSDQGELTSVDGQIDLGREFLNSEFSVGFKTASGRSVAINDSALTKARKLLEECSKVEEVLHYTQSKKDTSQPSRNGLNAECDGVESCNQSDDIPESSVDRSLSSLSNRCPFQTAKGQRVEVNPAALLCARNLLQSTEETKDHTVENKSNISVGFCKARGLFDEASKDIEGRCQEIKKADNLNSYPNAVLNVESSNSDKSKNRVDRDSHSEKKESKLMFTTGRGQAVHVSEQALAQVRLGADELRNPVLGESRTDLFCRTGKSTVNEKAFDCAVVPHPELDQSEFGNSRLVSFDTKESCQLAFHTARGNSVSVSKDVLEKVRLSLDDPVCGKQNLQKRVCVESTLAVGVVSRCGSTDVGGVSSPEHFKTIREYCIESPTSAQPREKVFKPLVTTPENYLLDRHSRTKQNQSMLSMADSVLTQTSLKHTVQPIISDVARVEISDSSKQASKFATPYRRDIAKSTASTSAKVETSRTAVNSAKKLEYSVPICQVVSNVSTTQPNFSIGVQENVFVETESCHEADSLKLPLTDNSKTLQHRRVVISTQSALISSKMKLKNVQPCVGSLWKIRNGSSKRLSWKDAVGSERPSTYSRLELSGHGILPRTMNINSSNSEEFVFAADDYMTPEAASNCVGIRVGDGAYLVFNDEGLAGKEEFSRAFLAMPGVAPNLVDKYWTFNHYRWIVWKLAAMEVSFPVEFGGRCLNPNQVMQQLKYRYDLEIDRSRRSALKKIFERDDTPKKGLVLCVCGIVSSSVLKLTDGWYSIPAALDGCLSRLVGTGKIRIGDKLCMYSAELIGSEEATTPLDAPKDVMLKICGNSTRRAAWHTRLGYIPSPRPPPLPLVSLAPDGGMVSCVDVVIVRVYPFQYFEKLPDGSSAIRTPQSEAKLSEKSERDRQRFMEEFYSKCRREFMKERQRELDAMKASKLGERSDKKSRSQISEDLLDEYNSVADPMSFEASLGPEQRRQLRNEIEGERQLQEEKMMKFIETRMAEVKDLTPSRNVTPMLKVRLAGCSWQDVDFKCHTLLTIWRPTEEVTELLKEGQRFLMFNLTTSSSRGNQSRARISLTAMRSTRYHRLEADENFRDLIYSPREVTKFTECSGYFDPKYDEVDVVGFVVDVTDAPSRSLDRSGRDNFMQTAYLVGSDGEFLSVKFWGGTAFHGVEDVVCRGMLVACCNLQWRKQYNNREPVPCVFATELSSFSTKPQQQHLRDEVAVMKVRLKNGGEKFLSESRRLLLQHLSTVSDTTMNLPGDKLISDALDKSITSNSTSRSSMNRARVSGLKSTNRNKITSQTALSSASGSKNDKKQSCGITQNIPDENVSTLNISTTKLVGNEEQNLSDISGIECLDWITNRTEPNDVVTCTASVDSIPSETIDIDNSKTATNSGSIPSSQAEEEKQPVRLSRKRLSQEPQSQPRRKSLRLAKP